MALERADVLAFITRDWGAARRHKDASMGRWVATHGAGAALRLADSLLEPVWRRATAAKARQGYSDLIAMRRKLDRVHANRR